MWLNYLSVPTYLQSFPRDWNGVFRQVEDTLSDMANSGSSELGVKLSTTTLKDFFLRDWNDVFKQVEETLLDTASKPNE